NTAHDTGAAGFLDQGSGIHCDSKPLLPKKSKPCFLEIRKTVLHNGSMGTELWERVRFVRSQAGLTQAQIAEACGITREAVSQWEAKDASKRTIPEIKNVRLLAQLTGASIDWLLSDDSELDPDARRPSGATLAVRDSPS